MGRLSSFLDDPEVVGETSFGDLGADASEGPLDGVPTRRSRAVTICAGLDTSYPHLTNVVLGESGARGVLKLGRSVAIQYRNFDNGKNEDALSCPLPFPCVAARRDSREHKLGTEALAVARARVPTVGGSLPP